MWDVYMDICNATTAQPLLPARLRLSVWLAVIMLASTCGFACYFWSAFILDAALPAEMFGGANHATAASSCTVLNPKP